MSRRALVISLFACACGEVGSPTAGSSAALTNPYASDPITAGLFIGSGGALDVAWIDSATTNSWHSELPISPGQLAPAGGAVAVARQSASVLTALFFDGNGALEVSWLDVTSGTGWAPPQPLTVQKLAPPGANIALAQQTDTTLTALFVDNYGRLQVEWLIVDGYHQWAGPQPISPAGTAPAGAPISLGKQQDNILTALYFDSYGALEISQLRTDGQYQWAPPRVLTPRGTAPAGAGIAAFKQDSLVYSAVFIDSYGRVDVEWLNTDGYHDWAGPAALTNPVAPAGAPIAMLKQSDTVLTAMFVDNWGRLEVEWLNTNGQQWAGPQPISDAIAPAGAALAMVNQTATITTALVVDNNGAVEMTKLDVTVGGWSRPAPVTGNGVALAGGRIALGKHLEKSCGGIGQRCCSETGCDDKGYDCNGPGGFGATSDPRNTCDCGRRGDLCCNNNSCNPGYACVKNSAGVGECQCGDQGQECCPTANGDSACNGWFQCTANVCQCGGPGQICCGGTTCNDGRACTMVGGIGRCPLPCGGAGQDCCPTGSPCTGSNLACVSNKCTTKTTTCSGALAGATAAVWQIGLKDANGCAHQFLSGFYANSINEAAGCAQRANPGLTADTSGQPPTPFEMKLVNSLLGTCADQTAFAFSSADAQKCMQAQCAGDDNYDCSFGVCNGISGQAPILSCAGSGIACGAIADGAGGLMQCGDCPAGLSCGGGGVEGACGCTPLTCEAGGFTCGSHDDGCGGIITCGAACCIPRHTCSRFACGLMSDGCGGTYCCGGVDCC
jgi:hypothetical protein